MVTRKDIRNACLSRPGAEVSYPFGPEAQVFKVGGRIFALLFLASHPLELNLKADPLRAEQQRACFPAIRPGYHMNKRHWNTVTLDGSLPREVLLSLLDDSYDLVVAGLKRSVRQALRAETREAP